MTLEIADTHMTSEVMDHHGLIAGLCKELKIAERINDRIGSLDPRRIVQPGLAVVAMIINGLGFTNRRLYLTPQFFESKAVGQLLEEGIKAADLNDHALGKALDEISDYGVSKLYTDIAFDIATEKNLLGPLAHIDSSSFSLTGSYETKQTEIEPDTETIEVTYGYSKDHRPDLKQVMISMATTGEAQIPFFFQPQNGNSSDKESFHESIMAIEKFKSELKKSNHEFIWVADSALYSKTKLLASNLYRWVSRVPESIAEAKNLLEQKDSDFKWTEIEKGYRYTEQKSLYGGIEQRWLLIYSEQAYKRESKTFEKKILKQEEQADKDFWHLGREVFSCKEDSQKSFEILEKKYPFHDLSFELEEIKKFIGKGRPKPGEEKSVIGFKLLIKKVKNQTAIDQYLNRKGRFIVATNRLNRDELSSEKLFEAYKDQQGVERGFRFFKDPWFMVDSFFVKKRSRIEALMMVMTLCLLVYNYGQYQLRKALEEKKETLPNQLNKPVANPTFKWVFQLMEGIAIVKLLDPLTQSVRALITNLSSLRIKIIRLLGQAVCKMYGIQMEIAGM